MALPGLSRLRHFLGGPLGIVMLAVCFVLIEGLCRYIQHRNLLIVNTLPFWPPTVFLFAASIRYGVTRVSRFHPLWDEGYKTWLEMTPWTNQKPLPMGPIELVWEDGLILGAIILASATQPARHGVDLLCAFFLSHLLLVTFTLFGTRIRAIGYILAFGLGLAVWLWRQPRFCLGAFFVLYLIAHEGIWRSLEQFPWPTRKMPSLHTNLEELRERAKPCGWPYDSILGDVIDAPGVSRLHATLCCALLSWWLFVLFSFVADPERRRQFLAFVFCGAMALFPLGRLQQYLSGYASPISFWGRIGTGRWIIPGYDYVFIAPICAFLSAPLALGVLVGLGLSLEDSLPFATGVAPLVTLIAPPRLRRWRLTGKYRIVPRVSKNAQANSDLVQVS